MTDIPELANLVVRALAAEDPDLASYRMSHLRTPALRQLCIELGRRVPAPMTADEDTLESAARSAAAIFGVTQIDITSATRRRQVVDARHVVCYAGHLLGMPYAHIGKFLGRDHSTIMSAVSRVGSDRRLRGISSTIAANLGWDREAS